MEPVENSGPSILTDAGYKPLGQLGEGAEAWIEEDEVIFNWHYLYDHLRDDIDWADDFDNVFEAANSAQLFRSKNGQLIATALNKKGELVYFAVWDEGLVVTDDESKLREWGLLATPLLG